MAQAFKRAGIVGGHPHRFRDTFAVDLLLRGVPIDQVSALLGHSAVKITEQHYLAFVAARRKQITDAVRRAWANGGVTETSIVTTEVDAVEVLVRSSTAEYPGSCRQGCEWTGGDELGTNGKREA